MTVYELKKAIANMPDEMEVVLGMKQTYGSDWAYNVATEDWSEPDVKIRPVNDCWGRTTTNDYCVITMQDQIGTVCYDE